MGDFCIHQIWYALHHVELLKSKGYPLMMLQKLSSAQHDIQLLNMTSKSSMVQAPEYASGM
jgi:hypothetical protein